MYFLQLSAFLTFGTNSGAGYR